LLGINLESPALLAVAVLLSLAMVVVALRGNSWMLWAAAGAAAAFGVLDIREVVHQIEESRISIALLAAGAGLGHLLAAVMAGRVARQEGVA
jgi:hypothetical protein